jgi:hypothetical protein
VRLNERVEIVHFDSHWNSEGYRKIQVAVNGQLSWPFDIHRSEYFEMTDDEFAAYAEKCGRRLIAHYGDARKVKFRNDGQIVPLEGDEAAQAA